MDPENYSILKEEADKINQAKKTGKRVITVGTTSTRIIEHGYKNNQVHNSEGSCGLYIYPGYQFKAIDSLITNFHTPKSTPFLLTSAFGGKCLIKQAYEYAISKEFRFYSYGDSMLIL